jgi:prevent-host-death family protein
MTIYDHIKTMKTPPEKTVKVAELKASLSAYLRAARLGHPVTVCDRDTPIARLVPYRPEGEPLAVREPIRALHAVALPKPLGRRVDSVAALLEERQPQR